MRILFVMSGLGAGGAEKIVNLLAHHRAACGDEVHVAALNAQDTQSYFAYGSGIRLAALSGPGRLSDRFGKEALRIWGLRRYLVATRPDLVISFLTKVNVMVRIASIGLNIPIVLSERNNFTSQGMNAIWRVARPLAARSATRLVMQTQEARNCLPARLRDKAVVIPNPVPPANTVSAVQAVGGARIVAVGRMEMQKGFDLLLEAFKLASNANPDLSLTIYGDGPQRRALQEQARALDLTGRVSMPGITEKPGDWTASGDIFVLSSRFEGFPNVLLEAMMAGMASIAFACPWGPAEILCEPETGVLVPDGDVRLLALAIRLLAGDEQLRRKLGLNAAHIARTKYAMAAVLEMWDGLIASTTTAAARRR